MVSGCSFECGAASGWLWAKPDAMREYLNHVHSFYKVKSIYVTEFGVDEKGESDRKTIAQQEVSNNQVTRCALASDKSLGIVFQGSFEDVPGFLGPTKASDPSHPANHHDSQHVAASNQSADDKIASGTTNIKTDPVKWTRPATLPRGLSIFDPLSAKSAQFADAFPGI